MRSETREGPATAGPEPTEDGGRPVGRRGGGRPRLWSSAQERNRAAGQRRTERLRLLTELQLALINARWDDPALQRIVNHGEELEVLRALTDHFRRRHWMRAPQTDHHEETRAEGGPRKVAP